MFKKADYFILVASFTAFIYSVSLWFGLFGQPNKDAGLFVGVWVPSILSLGCFTKLAMAGKSDG